jgi:hypothetical protein
MAIGAAVTGIELSSIRLAYFPSARNFIHLRSASSDVLKIKEINMKVRRK